MRAELPWNVAGIPPEAREAARAAARREGLSVGEWLTRRILRSFSGMEEELPPMPYESRAATGAPLDSWGLPPSANSRRDTEEMMARVGRSENESNEAWRRIDDQLRGLGRRIDSSERSHSESNRVISRTAQEINISAREQAQAFDQLGLNVMALNERLERLERSAAHDGIKDAVKALHQGLSRLADQITATANNSATQVTQLAGNLEQLAGRVGQARVDAEDSHRQLEDGQRQLEDRINITATTLEQRLSGTEKTAQFNTNALDHALEKIEANANQRATDQVENQRRAAQSEESLNRLEDSIARLEMRLPDAEFERRLDGIERSVGGMADRLENTDPAARFDAPLQALSHRLEALEKDHNDLLGELRARVLRPVEPPAYEAPAPRHEQRYEPPRHEPAAFEAPPFAEPPPPATFQAEPAQNAFTGYGAEGMDAFAPGAAMPGTPGGFSFDIPPETESDPFAPTPDFADVFADPGEPENFLSQARRSAREASQQAETERRGRFAGFSWGSSAEGEEKAKPRYLIPAVVALLVVLIAAAALFLSQRPVPPPQVAKPAETATKGPTYSVPSPPDGDDTQFVVAPQAGDDSGSADDYSTQRSPDEPTAPPRTALPLQQRQVRNAPVNPVPDGGQPQQSAPASHGNVSPDRVIQMANAGNPIALTILGLRALDGTGGTAVNLPDAVRFLTQAAEKGQAVAQYRLGTLYERGQGVPADGAKAAHWYEMAANQGNRKAMHNLAVSYASGVAGKKNMAEAARWFAKAAALGLSDSQFNLAVLYERGDGVPQSLLDAFKWYSIAATAGDSESKSRIGVLQTQLSDTDKAAANKSAATFHAAPLNRSANVPPEAADLGG
jgi:localization factor PodJL